MPVHEWVRVSPDVFHDFHLSWAVRLKDALNNRVLPKTHYALIEQHRDGSEHVLDGPYLDDELDPDEEIYIQKRRTVAIRQNSSNRGVAFLEIIVPGLLQGRKVRPRFHAKVLTLYAGNAQICLVNLFPPSTPLARLVSGTFTDLSIGTEAEEATRQMAAIVFSPQSKAAIVFPFRPGDRVPTVPLIVDGKETPIAFDSTYLDAFESLPKHVRPPLYG